jgi:protein TonB
MAPAREDQMFNNLIESSSHRGELRRRGSFFLITTVSYALLFAIAGVVSIHAYDAQMEDQSLDIVTMMPLVDIPSPDRPEPAIRPNKPSTPKGTGSKQAYFERKAPIANVNNPQLAPDKVSTTPNPSLPLPKGGIVKFTGRDINPGDFDGSGGMEGRDGRGRTSNTAVSVIDPPPAPVVKPAPKVIRKQIINSEAISLPKPIYPPIARQIGMQGPVNVQVLIDETGNVVSAKVLSGSPLLSHEAVKAAYQARFSPTMLGDQAVKVSGVITYNFVLQR